jgi:class 3 adenylate cyclase
LRTKWRARLGIELGIAIGISRGHIAVGRVTMPGRGDYPIVGDAISLANRLQSLARGGEVVVAAEVIEALGENELDLAVEPLPPLSIGDYEAQRIYHIGEPAMRAGQPAMLYKEAGHHPTAFQTTSS